MRRQISFRQHRSMARKIRRSRCRWSRRDVAEDRVPDSARYETKGFVTGGNAFECTERGQLRENETEGKGEGGRKCTREERRRAPLVFWSVYSVTMSREEIKKNDETTTTTTTEGKGKRENEFNVFASSVIYLTRTRDIIRVVRDIIGAALVNRGHKFRERDTTRERNSQKLVRVLLFYTIHDKGCSDMLMKRSKVNRTKYARLTSRFSHLVPTFGGITLTSRRRPFDKLLLAYVSYY